ncbi:MAG: hypothetical protein ACEQSX_07620 [Baekduiaceae bacterium]
MSRRVSAAALVAFLVLLLPAAADAKLSATVTIETKSSSSRIVAVLTSDKSLVTRQKPKTVSAVGAGKSYKLTRAPGNVTAKKLGTWRSKFYKGADAVKVQALAGKKISLRIRTRANKRTTVGATITTGAPGSGGTTGTNPTPAPANPTPAPAQPLFKAPGRVLTGTEAFESIKGYFLNSEFSDCQAGRWPTCQVENRYEHLPDGSFEYRRCTPVSGSDINTVGSYTVTGVQQNADGSWVIEYTSQGGASFYHWEVGLNGVVNGYYAYNGTVTETMANYYWRTPARPGSCYT